MATPKGERYRDADQLEGFPLMLVSAAAAWCGPPLSELFSLAAVSSHPERTVPSLSASHLPWDATDTVR